MIPLLVLEFPGDLLLSPDPGAYRYLTGCGAIVTPEAVPEVRNSDAADADAAPAAALYTVCFAESDDAP